ncbi:hypothetical protein D0Z07_1453 [Hyphodiscus hymeniophilus]|uniref:Uncharacterized protein n=1 Tax=Hyphodiscus hymeniophilus TaxID=353542 RepID=A0A9P6VQK1_9HELO|nr:hypothetical protein D0Z07_1453 [Hyphodiscus hymeniophilus]
MSDPLPEYAYTAIQDGHVRILEVLPGRDYDPIVCLIHGSSLDERPYYEALSYVCRDPPALLPSIYTVDSPERFSRAKEDMHTCKTSHISSNHCNSELRSHHTSAFRTVKAFVVIYPATEKLKRQHGKGFMQTALGYAGTSLNMMH